MRFTLPEALGVLSLIVCNDVSVLCVLVLEEKKTPHCYQIHFIPCSYNCVSIIFHHLNTCFPDLDINVCTCNIHSAKSAFCSTYPISALKKSLLHSEVAKAAKVQYRNKYNEITIFNEIFKGILTCCSYHFTS